MPKQHSEILLSARMNTAARSIPRSSLLTSLWSTTMALQLLRPLKLAQKRKSSGAHLQLLDNHQPQYLFRREKRSQPASKKTLPPEDRERLRSRSVSPHTTRAQPQPPPHLANRISEKKAVA